MIAAVTGTRAEYGLLRPVLQKLAACEGLTLHLIVTGTHLCARYGNTVAEIEADGLPIAARIPILPDCEGTPAADTGAETARTISRAIDKFTEHFTLHRPAAVLLLGDRYEIFAVAVAAAALHIPICHISGGDVTLGAADEYYRHCITKMAALHFPSCADSAARLIRMGEPPQTVFCVGGLGDENIRTLPKMSREELCESTKMPLDKPFAIVTYHPETAPGAADPAAQVDALCAAMAQIPGLFWVLTGANADAGGQVCNEKLRAFAAASPNTAAFIPSLGMRRYLSAMGCAALIVGNSSSGVVETPSFGVPAVNIGSRQDGRAICANVLCCPAEADRIAQTIRNALTPAFAALAKTAKSPYFGGDTSGKIVAALLNAVKDPNFGAAKRFYDGE